jgi:hypothetical protein
MTESGVASYPREFYASRNERTRHAARTILPLVLQAVPGVDSAMDVGCGVGTWLAVLRELGVAEVQGVDGPWVDRSLLVIPNEAFRHVDLTQPLRLNRRYALAMSLEVAEHLPESRAEGFVDDLVSLSDFVLFSAAVPGQGGRGHVNEQWLEYWAVKFAQRGYVPVDLVRRTIWHDDAIPYWYRQNLLLYVTRDRLAELRGPTDVRDERPRDWSLSVVHPRGYLRKVERLQSLNGSWRAFRRALRRAFSTR